MAYDLTPEGDAAALKKRRAELRAFSEEITELVARMPLPETYLEAERGARAVWVADRVLVRMRVETLGGDEEAPSAGCAGTSPASAGEEEGSDPSGPSGHLPMKNGEESDVAPFGGPLRHPSPEATSATSPANAGEDWSMPYLMTPVRLRLRKYADRLMEAAALLDKPTCYLEAERAQRYALAADRMLGQLYEPAKPAKASGRGAGGDDDDDGMDGLDDRPPYDDLEAWRKILEDKLHHLARDRARGFGAWPSGAPYVEGEPEPDGPCSPFNTVEYLGDFTEYTGAKDTEIRSKARAWYAETFERGWENYAEAEKAEVIARIEAGWDAGRLGLSASLHFSPLEGRRCREAADEGLAPSVQVVDNPSPGPSGHPLPSSGERWERNDPPPETEPCEGPAIRIVESIFAPSGPFGQRPCNCAISAPKCGGPCPIPP